MSSQKNCIQFATCYKLQKCLNLSCTISLFISREFLPSHFESKTSNYIRHDLDAINVIVNVLYLMISFGSCVHKFPTSHVSLQLNTYCLISLSLCGSGTFVFVIHLFTFSSSFILFYYYCFYLHIQMIKKK